MAIQWKFLLFGLLLGLITTSVEGAGKCKVCDDTTTTDEKCAKDPSSFTSECEADKCFSAVANNGRVKRGCVSDVFKCDGDDCKSCDATDTACNINAITFSCKKCDSSNDINCAQWSDPDAIKSQLCPDGVTKCVMNIKDDKNIERRCASKADEVCGSQKWCSVCETKGCNTGVFPSTRRRCYQCDMSSKCTSPTDNPDIASLPCALFNETEQCLMYTTSDTEMARGCSSNSAAQTACDAAKEKCVKCSTDNCNYKPYNYSQSLKCIQCSSSSSDCAWGHEKSEAINCAKQIPFYEQEGCYINKVSEGKVERGCTHDNSNLNCATTTTCKACNDSDGCNNPDEMDFTCYTCRSDLNPACSKPLEKDSFAAEPCRNPVTKETKGCYVEKFKDLYIRSCLVDADVTTRKQCLDNKYTMCDSCLEKNCNSDKLKNSAASVAGGVFLLASSLTLLRFF